MRAIAFVVGLTTFAANGGLIASVNHDCATLSPSEDSIPKGYIVNVDEKNSSFDFRETNGRTTRHARPLPVLMVIADMYAVPFKATWDDIRHVSVTGRITSVAVDPSGQTTIIVY